MVSPFRGRYESKLDPKGRLILPSGLRASLPSKDHRVVITNSQHKGLRCLDVYSIEAWEKLEKKISRMSTLKAEVQAFQRFYLAGGQVVEGDTQYRFQIPQSLRTYAGLTLDIVTIGMGEKFEIWSDTNWNVLYEGLAASFEDNLAAVAALDSGED